MRYLFPLLVVSLTACRADQTRPEAIFTPTPLPSPTAPAPAARLVEGPLRATWNGSGFAVAGTVQNVGDLCAQAVQGQIQLTAPSAVYTVAWSLPADQIVAPGETVAFTACCLPATASGQDLVSRQLLVQESVVCP